MTQLQRFALLVFITVVVALGRIEDPIVSTVFLVVQFTAVVGFLYEKKRPVTKSDTTIIN